MKITIVCLSHYGTIVSQSNNMLQFCGKYNQPINNFLAFDSLIRYHGQLFRNLFFFFFSESFNIARAIFKKVACDKVTHILHDVSYEEITFESLKSK